MMSIMKPRLLRRGASLPTLFRGRLEGVGDDPKTYHNVSKKPAAHDIVAAGLCQRFITFEK
jgi:hypothetical protein